jgi:exopolysaccharide biosynthesis polyprenyl glycosylphosphotransferase
VVRTRNVLINRDRNSTFGCKVARLSSLQGTRNGLWDRVAAFRRATLRSLAGMGQGRMIRRFGTELRALLMLADVTVAVVLAVSLSAIMFPPERGYFWHDAMPDPILGLALLVSVWVMILWLHGGYRPRARWSIRSDARLVARALVLLAGVTFAFLYLARLPEVSRPYLLVLFAALLGATLGVRIAIRAVFSLARLRGYNRRNVLVLGTGPRALDLASKLENHAALGLNVIGFLGDETAELPARWPYLGPIESLLVIIHERVVDEVAICLFTEDWGLIESIATTCESEGKLVRLPVPMPKLSIATAHVEDLEGTPVLSLLSGPNAALALVLKRLIDICAASFGMIMLAPLIGGIALTIALTEGRPIFFRQERVGLQGRRFRLVKFRSMVANADDMIDGLQSQNEIQGHAFKMSADPRITQVGRFLRRSSLDELPQLWNVLVGEMSLVGPRPPLPREVATYDIWHRRRLSMKPGITGLWQIEGRNLAEFDRWVQKDLEYIDRWSPWLDIQILLRTIPAVIRADGR